jgi:hypothetical protein
VGAALFGQTYRESAASLAAQVPAGMQLPEESSDAPAAE